MKTTVLSSLTLISLGVTSCLQAQSQNSDWYQWRGPNRDGISAEKNLDLNWSSSGPAVLWRVKGMGKGYSSVSISNGKLITMGEKGGRSLLIARSLEDGSELWEAETGGGGNPNCTPTIDPESGLAFGLSRDGAFVCTRLNSGEVVWKTHFEKDFGGKMMSGWGYSESPLIDGDRLICTPGATEGLMAALDKKTGKVIWKTDVSGRDLGRSGGNGAAYGSPVISKGGGVKQYVQLAGKGLIGVAADDGRLLWNYNRIANGTANVPTPIISGHHVFGSTGYGDGGSVLLKLESDGSKGVKATELYYKSNRELQNHHGGMVLVGDHLFLGHGHNNGFPQCVELKSGKVLWEQQRGAGGGSAAIVYADGHLFFRYEDHTLALIEATPDSYKLKASFKIASSNGKSWAHPVIHKGRLYLRDQDELLCYDLGG